MKYFSLVWSALFRSKTRTLLTLLSVTAAFLLFGLLDSVRVAFNSGGSVAGSSAGGISRFTRSLLALFCTPSSTAFRNRFRSSVAGLTS